jgi:VCBS repeat-containing protein
MRPIRITRALLTADDNGIAEVQQLVGAGDLTLNGALVAGGIAQLTSQRKVGMFSAGNISTVVFTIYGTDQVGNTISDTITGINNTTVSTTLDFLTVTRIAASAAVGSDVIAGTTGVGASQPIPLDMYLDPFNVSLFCDVTGTVNYTAQFTFDDVFASAGPYTWANHPDLTAATADGDGTYISPVTATRLVTNSGTGSIVMTVLQAGVL